MNVGEDEEVSGQVVAVMGSVRIDGEVGDQVVAVLGSVDLGPRAVVRGDVVTVGGRLRKAPGAQVRGAVTEVSLGDPGMRVHLSPWFDGWGQSICLAGSGPWHGCSAALFASSCSRCWRASRWSSHAARSKRPRSAWLTTR